MRALLTVDGCLAKASIIVMIAILAVLGAFVSDLMLMWRTRASASSASRASLERT